MSHKFCLRRPLFKSCVVLLALSVASLPKEVARLFYIPVTYAAEITSNQSTLYCRNLISRLRVATQSRKIITKTSVKTRSSLLPWIKKEAFDVNLSSSLNPAQIKELKCSLAAAEDLLYRLATDNVTLSAGEKELFSEALADATSVYYSEIGVPHQRLKFTNIKGKKSYGIKILADASLPADRNSPLVAFAQELQEKDVELILDFDQLIHGASATFYPGEIFHSPFQSMRLRSLFTNASDTSQLNPGLRVSHAPEAIHSSVAIRHELRHLENALKIVAREQFPFYGVMKAPFGFGKTMETPSEWRRLASIYGKGFFIDENDTYVHNLINFQKLLDDPLSRFNDPSYNLTFVQGTLYETGHALQLFAGVTEKMAQSLLSALKAKNLLIKFAERNGTVWASATGNLDPKDGALPGTFVYEVPLVNAKPGESKEALTSHFVNQLQLMLDHLPDQKVLGAWTSEFKRISNDLKYASVAPKDLMRAFSESLHYPQNKSDPNYQPLRREALEGSFHQLMLTRFGIKK